MKKLIILLVTIQFSQITIGQEIADSSVFFNHVALSVKDANKSAEFYKKALNLKEITNKTEIDGIKWLSLGGGIELHLITIPDAEIRVNKAIHFALTTAEFDSVIEKLKTLRIVYSDWSGETPYKVNIRKDGIKQIYFQDPDGYWIEVNSVGTKK